MVECVNCAKFKGCDLSSPNVNECADYKETLTNEEYLRSCNTEQLAEWLNNKIIICAVCDQQKICGYFINETCHLCPYHEGKNKSWEVWLKQPHSEVGK